MTTQENPTDDIFDTSVPIPSVSFSVDKTVIVEGGEPQLLTFNLSEPAPPGGLVVNLRVDDPDGDEGAGDTNFPPELISNITDFGQVEENGVVTANLTIAEGATVATFGVAAFEDDLVETGETYSFTLLEDENYIVDSTSTTITTTIEDAATEPTVSLTPATVTATEGETFAWNFSLDQPAPVGGLSLFLPITENSDLASGDVEYFVEGSNNISDFEFVTTSSISQIYAFGDSYSDDGLSFEISTAAVEAGVSGSFILPADPELGLYDPEGRWTNGPTAVEVLSEALDVDLTDYAVGGAKSGAGNYYSWLDSFQDTGVFGQIEQFSTELAGESADPDALYFIFASANDLFEYTDFGLPGTVEELAAQTVENIVEGVTDLSELGAEQFLVVNSSDLDILPGVIEFGQVAEATVFTDEVNELLPEALESLSQELGIEIALYDHVAISDEIRANPADFGLTNVDDPYQPVFPVEEPPTDAEPDEYYFWDEYHPTAQVHEIIGEDMASFVNSEIEDEVSVGFNLTIAEGATEATLVSEAIVDDIEEGEESFTTVIAEGENYSVNPDQNQVVTNLLDSGDSSTMIPTISFFSETVLSTEGDLFARNFSLDQPVPEGGLTVNVAITQNTEPQPGDTRFNLEASTGITDFDFLLGDNDILLGLAVTLAEGVTEATFVTDTVVDNIPETDEIASNTLADGEDYRADPNQNSLDVIFTDRTVVTLTTDEVNIAEGDTFAWNFNLNRPAPEGGLTLSLPITFNNDPEPGDVIYNVEGSTNIEDFGFIIEDDVSIGFTLTIPEGETEATLVSEAVVDDITEFDEIFTTVLADGLDYVANPLSNQVVTTIVEDGVAPPSSAPVVSITPGTVISTEGDTFAWDITLDQPVPEGGLTLNLPITQNNDPAPGDVIYNVEGSTGITDFDFIVEDNISIGFSVTLEEGVTSATLVSETVADEDLDDSADEIFTTVVADGVDYRANPDSNEVVTVLTREPVVTITTDEANATEGETFAWNFSLNQPAPEGGLTLSLPITQNNDPEPGDVIYNVEGSTNITDFDFLVVDNISVGFTLTIAEGETEATLVSQAVADDIAEVDEIFTTVLNDGDGYRANPLSKEVVTTIFEQDLSQPPEKTDQIVSFQLEDIFIPVQGGVVSDTTIIIDQIDGLESFPDIVPLAEFVKDFLNTYPNPDEFFQDISTNLSQAILDSTELGFADTVDAITVNLERQPAGIVPFFFTSEATNTPSQPSNQIVSFNLQDILVPVQGGTVADATITIDQIDGLETFPDIVPVADFVREFLTTYPNPNDFYQTISNNLSEAILDNPELGLSETVDSISVELEREAAGIVPFSFSSEAIAQPPETTDQIVSFRLEDVFLPVQGGVVSDTTITIDQIDGLETFPDIVPLAELVKDFLNTYPNENDFFQDISTNLAETILDNPELGFSDTVDSISVDLERQPAGIVPFLFSSEAINVPSQPSNQIVSFNLQDILVPVQGGVVSDTTITIDQIDGLETFPDIVPVADFVREFLTNYPNPNDFYQTISNNLSEAILDNPELGLSETVDSISVELEREAAGIVPFSFSSKAIVTVDDNTEIIGDDDDNVLEGTDIDNIIAGGFGNDEILGGGGDDILRGDLNSSSSGGTVGGNDTISGGAGDDRIGGKAGDDELFGDEGNDLIYGDDGDDLIRGGLGDDTLIGDDFSGGSGADTFVLAAGEGTDTIVDFEVGIDIIGLADGLTPEDLSVTTASGNTTIAVGDETLAIVEGVVSVDQIDYTLV